MNKRKIIISILIVVAIVCLTTKAQAKYVYTEIETAIKFNIDRTPPLIDVEYTTHDEYVEVKLNANERIKPVEGWEIDSNETTLTKKYYQNMEEQITIYDISDNYTKTDIVINTLDEIKIEVKNISNNNEGYENYANLTHRITLEFDVKSVTKLTNTILQDNIIVKLDGNKTENIVKSLIKSNTSTNNLHNYTLNLSNIQGNGKLSIEIAENLIRNEGGLSNEICNIETGIIIDNISPNVKFSEEQTDEGYSKANVISEECIRQREGWEISADRKTVSKLFPSNIAYKVEVMDLAGNITEIELNITSATYIELIVGAYNTNVGWTYTQAGSNVIGKQAAKASKKNKIESLLFRIEGKAKLDKDYLQGKVFVYDYWNNFTISCTTTGNTYNFGVNPTDGTWRSMLGDNLAIIDGKEYFQFGGSGMNQAGQCDIDGNHKLSSSIAKRCLYGISELTFKLKDYSEYSVIYQPYTAEYGWIEPEYNETTATMGYPTVMSAMRIAIIPNSELQDVYDFWNLDNDSMEIH